jgi:hypothetical protein
MVAGGSIAVWTAAAGAYFGFNHTPVLATFGLSAVAVAGGYLKNRFANVTMDALAKSATDALEAVAVNHALPGDGKVFLHPEEKINISYPAFRP